MDIYTASRATQPVASGGFGADGRAGAVKEAPDKAYRANLETRADVSQTANPLHRSGEIQFRIDQEADRLVVSVFDQQGALLRQIPGDVVLQMAKRLEQVLSDGSLGLHAEA